MLHALVLRAVDERLKSEVSVYVVRAFVRLRQAASQHQDLAERLAALEDKTEQLAMQHDTSSRNTRIQLRQLFLGHVFPEASAPCPWACRT